MKKNKVTIKDIAEVLGITPSAVSKALNNHSRISDKTKSEVIEVAKKLNYQPNHLASALRKGKSNLVGLIMPRASSHFFASVLNSVEKVLNTKGYHVIISQSNESYKKECESIDALLLTQVDGIIASLANETLDFSHYKKIKEKGIPLILFDRGDDDLDVDFIGIDDFKSSHIIIDHLVEQGCKRIAHIGGFSHTRIYKERILGYKDALNKHNLAYESDLLLEGDLSIEDGRRKTEYLLNLPNRPDAIYAAGDFAAIGALQVLKENNIKIPNEIALVGFSNEPFTSFVSPSITTINQHSEQIGKLAAETFLYRMEHPNEKVSLNKLSLNAELIVRDSSNRKKIEEN